MQLKEYLESRNLTPGEFCKRSEIDPATLSRFLTGKMGISIFTALKIIRSTKGKVTLEDLVETKITGSSPNPAGRDDGKSSGGSAGPSPCERR